jgi:hypothetical protein
MMPKSKPVAGIKAQRKEAALKKAKQKKVITAVICTLAVAAVLVFVIHMTTRESTAETFSGGGLIVQLLDDGRFSASLAHNIRKNGTYTKTDEDGRIKVSFDINGAVEIGWIENNSLRVPVEWEDSCGHTNILPRR